MFCSKYNKFVLLGGLALAAFDPALANDEPKLEVSGLIETEVGFSNNKPAAGGSEKGSDTVLATVELAFDAKLSDMVSTHVLLLHEQDDTPGPVVDEGILTLGKEEGFSLSTGLMYVPFGVFETNMVSDPLTLEMGETQESAIAFNYHSGEITGVLYLFNGDTQTTSEDKIEHSGFSINYETDNINVGLDYISSVGDSDGVSGALVDAGGNGLALDSYVPGLAIHAIYKTDTFNIIVERVAAMKSFNAADSLGEVKPITTNVEFGYSIDEHNLALSLQGSKEAEGLGLPEKKFLLGYSRDILEHVGLGVELARSTGYEDGAGNTDKETTLTAQLAVEF